MAWPKFVVAMGGKRVPAHVGNFQIAVRGLYLPHIACDPAQPRRHIMFEPARRHQLHANAYSKEGLAAHNHLFLQGFAHAGERHQPLIAILEGPHTGEHYALGPAQAFGIGGDSNLSRLSCGAFECFQGGMQIARAIINNHSFHGRQFLAPKRPRGSWEATLSSGMGGCSGPATSKPE